MVKKRVTVLSILFLVIIGAAAAVYFMFLSSTTVSAQLHVESGGVTINGNPVYDSVTLKKSDVIETGSNGKATVILYESIVINLEGNTKISIDNLVKSNPKVTQEKGETWNTFTKLSGVDSFTASSGNSIASVRGTAFGLKENYLLGGEGEVSYQINGQQFFVTSGKVIETAGSISSGRDATSEEIQKIVANMERAIEELRYLRNLEIDKNPKLYSIIKSQTGLTDGELVQYMLDVDEGKIDVDELAAQSPIKIGSLDKIVGITKAIQKIKTKISEL